MTRSILNYKRTLVILGIFGSLSFFAVAGETKEGEAPPFPNRIEIRDFHFNPETIRVKSGAQITWINKDEEPHTVVSVEKQFKKSQPLDTDQSFTVTMGAPGTYSYFCSVHPKMTGTIIVEKS